MRDEMRCRLNSFASGKYGRLTEERREDLDWNRSHVRGCSWVRGTYCYTMGDF